jgi:hypothetical protein
MSIVYRIDHAQGITLVLWDGVVTADEYLAHVRQLLSDADWPPHRHRQLGDLRTASVDAIDEATLETAAALFGKHPEISHFKTAILASEAFNKAVIFKRFISRYRPSVIMFNSLDIACTWLGIDAHGTEHTLRLLRVQARGRTEQ